MTTFTYPQHQAADPGIWLVFPDGRPPVRQEWAGVSTGAPPPGVLIVVEGVEWRLADVRWYLSGRGPTGLDLILERP